MNKLLQLWDKVLPKLIDLGLDLLVIVFIFLLAKLFVNIFSKITRRSMIKANDIDDKEKSQQIKTSLTLTHSANRYIIYALAVILCLRVLGLGEQVSSALVAAGIGGLVISFGAQSIVKDMLAGLFLMFEKQFFVGDYVKIAGYEGKVTSIALRVTYLDCAGKKVIIPNGEIKDVVNYSKTNNFAVISIPTPYECDTRKVIKVIQGVIDKYYETHQDILTDNKAVVAGIDTLDSSSVNITVRVETKPLKHWEVQRDLKLLIKEEFEKKKIDIPYSQLVVHKNKKA